MSLSIGGRGGSGGNGGDIMVTNSGNIFTEGVFSHGLVAQSVGGGGGLGGYIATIEANVKSNKIVDITDSIENGSLDIALMSGDGSTGNGGDIIVTNSGNILTESVFSHGLVAQSVGGGGGLAGISNELGETTTSFNSNMQGNLISQDGLGVLFAGSVGGNGSGGNVTVNNSGDIITQGDYSHGIFAQSVGGTGSGGSISVTHSGNILAEGADSDGILAQSAGATGGGDISATILSGTVQGGSGTGAAVRFLEGSTNTLTSYGTITSKDGAAGNAIIGTSGNDAINNYGTVTGIVDLGTGTNSFNNGVASTFNPGPIVSVGAGNMFTNSGMLSPGGQSTFQTTVLSGTFEQTNSGTLAVQIDREGNHDKLLINSGGASLSGNLSVTKGNGPYTNDTVYDILETTDGTVSGAFNNVFLPEAKPLISFVISQRSNAVDVVAVVPSCTKVATNSTEIAIANYLDRIMPSATGDLSKVLGEFQSLYSTQFGSAFSSLSPDSYDDYTGTSFDMTRRINQSLQQRMLAVRSYAQTQNPGSEKPILLAFAGSDASLGQFLPRRELSQIHPKNGVWINVFGQRGDQDNDHGSTGYTFTLRGATMGFDHSIGDNFIVGVSAGPSRAEIDLNHNRGDGNIRSLVGSLYGSYYRKNLYVDGVLSYGRSDYDNDRLITIGSLQRNVHSTHDGDLFSAFLGTGYTFDVHKWLAGPIFSLQYTYLDEESFREQGADSVSLIMNRRETDAMVSELGFRVRRVFETNQGVFIPELSSTWLHDFDIDDRVVTASFAGSPGSSFSVKGQDVMINGATLGAGVTFLHKGGLSTSLQYRGEFREGYQSHGIMGELRFKF